MQVGAGGWRMARYLVALLMLVGGIVVVMGFGFGAGQTRSDRAEGFSRFPVPSQSTFRTDHPATYYVYSEGTACLDFPNCHGALYPVTVAVTGPSGRAVQVERADGPSYMIGGTEGTGVARFDAVTAGDYRIAVSTGPYSEGRVAIGEAFPAWTGAWVANTAGVALLAGGAAVIVLPGIRRRRRGDKTRPETAPAGGLVGPGAAR